jgi:hypothetical protein
MFGISRQSSGFWIAVAMAFALGYIAASLPWNAEAQTGNCRSAVSSDVDNDVPPIVGMGNQSADDSSTSESETQPSSQ